MLTTTAGLVGLATLAGSVNATPLQARDSWSDKYARCNALWEEAPKHLADLTVNLANYVDAGTTINETANGAFIPVGTDLGPFCRFSANITTSDKSSVRFEVWLPDDDAWNGNHMMVGNGGVAGFIRYDEMQVPVNKYGFAVACTNTGHDGTSGDGSFAFDNPESQIDFGYRAVHLTTVYSKEIVNLYYGKKAELSYWNGCSSGGKQGLKEIQMFPEDYDAALVGAPAWDWSRLNGWTYYVNAIVNNPSSTGFITPPTWTPIHQEVLAQCDGLDGVEDGIITHPGKCFLDFDKFGCNGGSTVLNSTNCLQAPQLETLKNVYKNWTDPSTGEFIFPAFNIGGEFLFAASVNGVPYGPAPNYFLYQILNVTSGVILPVDTPELTINGVPPTEAQVIELVRTGEVTNPGNTIAGNPDLSPFFKRGGKLLHYVGGADFLIPTNTSHVYYEKVRSKLGDVSNSYRFYEVAGMGHCSGGAGAYNFGQAGQAVKSAGGDSQSSQFDAKHDAVLALRKWREEGVKPGELIGAKYVDDDLNKGVAYTRPICPWPALPVYKGGDKNKASSFKCENAY